MIASPFVSRATYNAAVQRAEKWEERYFELAERSLELAYGQGILPRKAQAQQPMKPLDVAPRDDLPAEIWEAIEEMVPRPSDPLRGRLMDYALENRRRWGNESDEIAQEIRIGNSVDTSFDALEEDEG